MANMNNTLRIDVIEELTTSEAAPPSAQFVMRKETADVIIIVFEVVLCNIVSFCGIFTNAIVIVVFYKQGIMSESSNVSLFALAVCDFLVQFTHITICISDGLTIGEYYGLYEPFYIEPLLVSRLGFRPKIVLNHVICWLTAYLSFERCFSVLFPFKVRLIFTPKRSLIAVLCIFGGSLFTFIPNVTYFGVADKVVNNRTFITVYVASYFSQKMIKFSILLNPIILRNTGISIVVLSNILILIKIKSSKDWRKSVTSSTTKDNTKSTGDDTNKSKKAFHRETKLIKMVTMISAIFLTCTAPDMIAVIVTQTDSAILGPNAFFALYSIVFVFESVNSAVNILVYYSMSSKFKEQFKVLFGSGKKKKIEN